LNQNNITMPTFNMHISFEGGKKVNAEYNGHLVKTDQPLRAGGDNTAPDAFTMFLSSIGTCAGVVTKSVCDQREIDASEIYLTQEMEYNPTSHLIEDIKIEMHLPKDFPEKYRDALYNAVNTCTVKRHLMNPPNFQVDTVID